MPTERPAESGQEKRRRAMELLAQADELLLAAAWDKIASKPDVLRVRGPETGLIMLRGRIGGGGSPFNLGEATLTRATIRLASGEIGHGQALGLSHRKAELVAIFDALAQRPDHQAEIDRLLTEIESGVAERDAERERQTAATRVDFFTMVRGED